MLEVFMLLFNFTLTTPDNIQRDEIVNVYSRHFETEVECEEFLNSWTSIIKSRGVDTLQEMLKDGYKVELNAVSCARQYVRNS
jgi:hypothetical protein|tara:strand:+ start:1464 stop:1712 length:249 start_codon:yes stop_codon:yes gene_type:complete